MCVVCLCLCVFQCICVCVLVSVCLCVRAFVIIDLVVVYLFAHLVLVRNINLQILIGSEDGRRGHPSLLVGRRPLELTRHASSRGRLFFPNEDYTRNWR